MIIGKQEGIRLFTMLTKLSFTEQWAQLPCTSVTDSEEGEHSKFHFRLLEI